MAQTANLGLAVNEYKNGNAEAFNILYQESSKYIYTCIYKVVQGNDNAMDIVSDIMQDTYVEISRSIAQLENEESFLSWAGMIATRKCYAYLKKNKRYVLLNEEDDTFDSLSDSDEIIPEAVMQDKEKQRLLREIIENRLTEMQKLCIIAYYFHEKKQSEIAEELGIPENTVKTNLSRAKQKIKDGVLDLEKKEGTRLYSVAPFLLLLFKEDVEAAVIPEAVTQCVYTAVREAAGATSAANAAAANSAGAKVAAGQTAKMALKTKIILGIVGVGVAAAVAGTTYAVVTARQAQMAANDMQQDDDGWVTPELEPEESEQVAQENTQEDTQEDTEASEEEMESFKILSEYMVSADWEEDTYEGNSIELKDYETLDFIDMLSTDNVDGDGKYDAYLPEHTVVDGLSMYTEQSIKDYVQEVFGLQLKEKTDFGVIFENGMYYPERTHLIYSRRSEIEKVDIDGSLYHVSGIVTFGENLDASQYGDYMASYRFEMTVKKNEDSLFGFTFQSLTYKLYKRLGDSGNNDAQGEYDTDNTPESENVNSTLSGTYRATGGEEMQFNENGNVLVSEGNSSTWCSYSLDADGNLAIYASSETLEGKYNAEQDCIKLYGTNYYRH